MAVSLAAAANASAVRWTAAPRRTSISSSVAWAGSTAMATGFRAKAYADEYVSARPHAPISPALQRGSAASGPVTAGPVAAWRVSHPTRPKRTFALFEQVPLGAIEPARFANAIRSHFS